MLHHRSGQAHLSGQGKFPCYLFRSCRGKITKFLVQLLIIFFSKKEERELIIYEQSWSTSKCPFFIDINENIDFCQIQMSFNCKKNLKFFFRSHFLGQNFTSN